MSASQSDHRSNVRVLTDIDWLQSLQSLFLSERIRKDECEELKKWFSNEHCPLNPWNLFSAARRSCERHQSQHSQAAKGNEQSILSSPVQPCPALSSPVHLHLWQCMICGSSDSRHCSDTLRNFCNPLTRCLFTHERNKLREAPFASWAPKESWSLGIKMDQGQDAPNLLKLFGSKRTWNLGKNQTCFAAFCTKMY